MANQRACKAWTPVKSWAVSALRARQSRRGSCLCQGQKGARAEDKGSEDRDLPNALKAGIDISIHFICKFSPADNSHFQGKGGCPTNADDRGTCRWRKGHGALTPFGFCHPSLTALCLLPRRLGWLPVASDSIAFQIAAATLVFCFFFMREWSVRFAHSEP